MYFNGFFVIGLGLQHDSRTGQGSTRESQQLEFLLSGPFKQATLTGM